MSKILKKSGIDSVTGAPVDVDLAVVETSNGRDVELVGIKPLAGNISHNREMPAAIAVHAGGVETANHVEWTQGEEISLIIVSIFPTTPGVNTVGQVPVLLVADAPDGDFAKTWLETTPGVSTDVEYYPLQFGEPNEIPFDVAGQFLSRIDIAGAAVRCVIEAYK